MTEKDKDPWEIFKKQVKALTLSVSLPKPPLKVRRKKPLTGGDIPEPPSFQNVSRETFLSLPLHYQSNRKVLRKIKIEKTLDLHGLTLKEAYYTLLAFVQNASRHQLKTVLIITGKGLKQLPPSYTEPPRLRLKEAVPQWLARPPLKDLVASISLAKLEHGGEGAYYVFLKSGPPKKAKG